MAERVGFIGVGRMGVHMVRRLLAHGYEVAIRDVNDAAVAPFKDDQRVTICASPREVATRAPTILLSLPLPRALDEVVLGPDGIAEAGSGRVVIDTSTSGVAAARRVSAAAEARGLRYLDAPVSGGVPGAEKGTLAVMVAGDKALHDAHKPLLTIIGANVFYVGAEPGQGQAMKLANNMLSGTAMAATAEALAVTTKAGIPPKLALDVINVSSGRNTATQDKFPKSVITGTFDYGFLVKLLLKDVKLFEELAEELGVPTLVAAATVNAWRIATAAGLGDQDFTAIARMYERWAGVEIREPGAPRSP
jgi:3-hydroxyisobutyrate dehydrogenase-like beta-hydroxyacid dehydrogenase